MPRTLLPLLLLAALTGCNLVHKQNVQQGNVVDEDELSKLEIGMSKRQVEVLLGAPVLRNAFHADRWDYINTYAQRGGKMERRILTIEFDDDQVTAFHGSYLDDQAIGGEDVRDLNIIDPNTNQPVLPQSDPTEQSNSPIPTADRPSGGQ
jgi:outer membrane protein assembly factor BamE